jgi:hypothetical protein
MAAKKVLTRNSAYQQQQPVTAEGVEAGDEGEDEYIGYGAFE